MNNQSILKKYRRQPKIQIDLPSQGKFYPPGALHENQTTNINVFSMTPNDEIMFKTPDALINGDATVNTIKSCIPAMLNPWVMPTIDIDTVLVGIRIATYGETMNVNKVCGECGSENTYEVPLSIYIDRYATRQFNDTVQVDRFTFKLRPLTYQEFTVRQKTLVGLRRTINQIITSDQTEEEKAAAMDPMYVELAKVQLDAVYKALVSISVDGETETDTQEIIEFFENNETKYIAAVKKAIENNYKNFEPPKHNVVCSSCEADSELQVTLDTSDFFGKG